MNTILFSNPPFWQSTPDGLRQGIRAGSRWPFTRPAAYAPDAFKFGSYLPYPFFLGSAAAYVARETADLDCEVVMRDSIARGESYQTFFAALDQIKPSALVVETGAAAWEHDLNLLRYVKGRFPEIRIAVAGPTAASASKTTPPGVVDAWLLGEYEKNSLTFAKGASGVLGFNIMTLEEMNAAPGPMFDWPVAFNYWDACPQGQEAPHIQIWASRGCVFKCQFCSYPATMTSNDPEGTNPRSVRHYSVAWIEKLIRDCMKLADLAGTPLKHVYYDDDWFNNKKSHVLAVCALMKRIGLPWTAMCRADTSDDETWLAMRDSGCRGVKVGFESASQRVVDEIINKRLDVAKAVERCKWLMGIGLSVHTTWSLGHPGERPEEKQQTLDLIREMYAVKAHATHQLSGVAEIEGTPLHSLHKAGALMRYPGAHIDENYKASPDGQLKIEQTFR